MLDKQQIPPIVMDMFEHIFNHSDSNDWRLSEEYILYKAYKNKYFKMKGHIAKRQLVDLEKL